MKIQIITEGLTSGLTVVVKTLQVHTQEGVCPAYYVGGTIIKGLSGFPPEKPFEAWDASLQGLFDQVVQQATTFGQEP